MRHTVVLGGGFAGLAAGVRLAARGIRVTLLEARPRLGGRAYSFCDEESGAVVDNGQHAMMGCYTETIDFFRTIGAQNKLVRQDTLHVEMRHRQRGAGTIRFAKLPSPLHAALGILRYRLLSPRERQLALLGGLRLLARYRTRPESVAARTVEEVLLDVGQSEHSRASFWYPIAIATLNELPARASAGPFCEVLRRAFFSSREGSQFVLSSVGLSDLYTDDARRFIEERGGEVMTKAIVERLLLEGERVRAVRLRDGREFEADTFVSTVPPRALRLILPAPLRESSPFRGLSAFESSPIVSVHLWSNRKVTDSEFVGLIGTATQWVFNRSRLTPGANGDAVNGSGQALSVVISAGREIAQWDTERIRALVIGELREMFPQAREATFLRAVVVKEKHATISLTPAAERMRLAVRTPLRNFFLAGDWTATGLPATIESAVLSARLAAEQVQA